jgi:RNA 2',3'-cyclic 3'-phosphodiesterase
LNRLFVAIWPSASLTGNLRALERPPRPGLRWTTEDQWHVTLRFLGEMDTAGEEALRARLAGIAGEVSAVEATAGPRPRSLGPGVWVLPVAGLGDLAAPIAAATPDLGQPPPRRRYRGHLTLARARRPGLLRGLPEDPLTDAWTVNDITLVRSHLGSTGARYDVVGRWPLPDRPS